jgi:DNA-binding transcriptional MerR regulator
LSIGEVLSLLRAEFADITISKIRFLESQGLLDPERTPSGYRKFYDEDVERLRWILRQQREHFLPLKVIKGRLSKSDPDPDGLDAAPDIGGADQPAQPAQSSEPAQPPETDEADRPAASGKTSAQSWQADLEAESWPVDLREPDGPARPRSEEAPLSPAGVAAAAAPPARAQATGALKATAPDSHGAGEPPGRPAAGTAAAAATFLSDLQEGPQPARSAPRAPDPVGGGGPSSPATGAGRPPATRAPATQASAAAPAGAPANHGAGPSAGAAATPGAGGDDRGPGVPVGRVARPTLAAASPEVNLTVEELAAGCGLPVERVTELERFGLLAGRDIGGTAYYGEEAQAVANLAAAFAGHGVEARHLRMYKNAADRESGLFEQIVMPLIKQRNPNARLQAAAAIDELSRLGGELRETLLRRSLRDAL